ncbi:hypothetical protein NDU88_007463 [Pleurodeles waltl]|uniref:Uncharacterized protein n=1 Tax=Pleurodeles waltl TaxID=8319 RepID=A0AAV7U0G1_PLEWA|nr:hypothetical protein NDU88_007463 [Pleurodeles waltl]
MEVGAEGLRVSRRQVLRHIPFYVTVTWDGERFLHPGADVTSWAPQRWSSCHTGQQLGAGRGTSWRPANDNKCW